MSHAGERAGGAGGGSRTPHERVVVVGAGVGGLTAALRLVLQGLDVTVVEAGAEPGGKMRAVAVDGVHVDAGPTVFTMRWVFDELLADAGLRLDTMVPLTRLDLLARHAWRADASRLDLHADLNQSADAIARFASPQEGKRFLQFAQEARRIYGRLEGPHIRSQRPSFVQMVRDLGVGGLRELSALGPFASLWQTLGRHFQDPRLRQLFARYATYCGASPWAAPATLMLVAHVELDGVWSIEGGMPQLARALADAAAQRGVRFIYNQRVERIDIQNSAVSGVVLNDQTRLPCSRVVHNGDVNALALGLLGQPAQAAGAAPPRLRDRSLSALTWAMHVGTQGFELARHNVFFDDHYDQEFDDVFKHRRLPQRGTVYLCAQDRGGTRASQADITQPARERLLALVNAPAHDDAHALSLSEIEACEQRSLNLLTQCGLHLSLPKGSATTQVLRRTPADFAALYPGSAGALYGPATHGWMSLFKRSSARTPIKGLYLAGGSVHPGPGVPMAAMSGRLAAATLLADLDSTSRSRRVRIAGGTSTPSAMTVSTR
jgi:1-hydroxycarotenoid 3,4-desaturase